MWTFERTYQWISFRIDLRKATPQLWMLLGEGVLPNREIILAFLPWRKSAPPNAK